MKSNTDQTRSSKVVEVTDTVYFVEARSADGIYYKVEIVDGLLRCSCLWGRRIEGDPNAKPCHHMHAVVDYVR